MASQATSRLRKAFRYPSEDGSDEDPSDLDEEHQEQLITSLAEEDARKNVLYRKLFLLIPLSATLYFTYSFVVAQTTRQRTVSFLSFSSLICSAYILHFMPIEKPARRGKVPIYQVEAAKGPLERYLVWSNAVLVVVLQIAAVVSWSKGEVEQAWKESLGLVVFGLMLWAREQLKPMDLEELEKARYELKGA